MTIAETPIVYWVRGCANCTRLKGYLSDRGVAFEAVDVQVEEHAFEDMRKAGMASIPSVRLGDRWATGFDLDKVNELLGLDGGSGTRVLPVAELVDRAAWFLEADARYALQIPPDHHDDPTPTMGEFKKAFMFFRDGRPYVPHHSSKNLVHHIAGHGEKFKRFALAGDGVHELGFSMAAITGDDAAFGEPDPGTPMYQVAQQMRLCASDVRAWLATTEKVELSSVVDTHYGPQTLRSLMQTMVTSLAQHTRQLLAILDGLEIVSDGPPTRDCFEGLAMASSVWGEQ